MESIACRRRASDADQSTRWSYSATEEREPAMVKEEPEWGECGASEAAVAEGLYTGHEVKEELVIGPELIQQRDVAFSIQNKLNRMAVAPCKLKPAGGAGAAPECTHTRPGEGPCCNTSHEQQFELKGCSVRLERILMEHLPTCSTCHVIFLSKRAQEHSCTHSAEDSKFDKQLTTHGVETAMRHLKTESERLLQHSSHDARIFTEESFCSDQIFKQTHTVGKPFTGGICQSQFAVKSHLSTHIRTHTGEKFYSCDVCNSRFLRNSSLTEHKRTHTGEKLFSCDVCTSRFSRKDTLDVHKRTHSGEKPFSCDVCQSRFSRKSSLKKHRRTHTDEKPFVCDICKLRFRHNYTLNVHRRTHSGEKPFSCDVCKLRFRHRNTLNEHRRTHTGAKPFSCDICNSEFSHRSSLKAHIRIHTGEKPFSCDICELRFRRRNALNAHRRIHTDVKPFSCSVCKSRFSRKSTLQVHRRTHTGEKPFSIECIDLTHD